MRWLKKLKRKLKPPKKFRNLVKKGIKSAVSGIPIVGGIASEIVGDQLDKAWKSGKKKVKEAIEGIDLSANINNLDVNIENMPNFKVGDSTAMMKKALPIIITVVGVAFIFVLTKKR